MKKQVFQVAVVILIAAGIFLGSFTFFWIASEPGPITLEQKLDQEWRTIQAENVALGLPKDTVR
jgi:hypothetical protein